MTRLLQIIASIFICFGCKPQAKTVDKIEFIKQYNYRIVIDIWNGFWGGETKYILDNRRIKFYDSTDKNYHGFKPLTLVCVSDPQKKFISGVDSDYARVSDSIEIKISKQNSDELFDLTCEFFRAFRFNNIDTFVNNTKTELTVLDDSHGFVEIDFNGRKLSAVISSISNPAISTVQFNRLLKFVEKFKTNKKR